MSVAIDKQIAIDALRKRMDKSAKGEIGSFYNTVIAGNIEILESLPPAQPEYEELTPEEAASEIASGSVMSAQYWLDAMIRLNKMGYAICRKRR